MADATLTYAPATLPGRSRWATWSVCLGIAANAVLVASLAWVHAMYLPAFRAANSAFHSGSRPGVPAPTWAQVQSYHNVWQAGARGVLVLAMVGGACGIVALVRPHRRRHWAIVGIVLCFAPALYLVARHRAQL